MSSAAAGYYGLTVALGLGIAVYFELPREPALWLGPSLRYRPRRRRQAGQDQLAVDDNDAPLGKRHAPASSISSASRRYQQVDAVGYVLLASAAAIGCDCRAVTNASRAYSKAIAGSDSRGAH